MRDEKCGRLGVGWQVNLALLYGRRGEFERAVRLIESAYAIDKDRKDGFANLGWIKAEQKDWEDALELMLRDAECGRLSSSWQISLAELFGRRGEIEYAADLIEEVYSKDPDVKDGYVRLGWIKAEKKDWEGAFSLAVRDEKCGRLGVGWQVNLALL